MGFKPGTERAALNNIKDAGGLSESKNGRWSECQSSLEAVRVEISQLADAIAPGQLRFAFSYKPYEIKGLSL